MLKFIFATILFPVLGFASPNLGKKLGISSGADGSLNLGVHYVYDFDIQWSILFGTTISQNEIAALPAQLRWHIENALTGEHLSADRKFGASELFLGTLGTKNADEVKRILLNQKNAALVFTKDDGTALVYVDIGELCRTRSTYFMDLTNTSKRCDQVKASDLP